MILARWSTNHMVINGIVSLLLPGMERQCMTATQEASLNLKICPQIAIVHKIIYTICIIMKLLYSDMFFSMNYNVKCYEVHPLQLLKRLWCIAALETVYSGHPWARNIWLY